MIIMKIYIKNNKINKVNRYRINKKKLSMVKLLDLVKFKIFLKFQLNDKN